MYETYHTPSWDYEKSTSHHVGKVYHCEFCGVACEDHEVFLRGGKPFCGCCK
jgi:hypothetical protein